jgi:hypothetical protein
MTSWITDVSLQRQSWSRPSARRTLQPFVAEEQTVQPPGLRRKTNSFALSEQAAGMLMELGADQLANAETGTLENGRANNVRPRSAPRRRSMMYRYAAFFATVAAVPLLAVGAPAQEETHPKYDYPTAARADYVIGCLAANGFNRLYLDKCACGIDTIANQLPYDDYEKAATILSMQQGGLGQRGAIFRDTPIAKEELEKLRRAEAEVNLRCR